MEAPVHIQLARTACLAALIAVACSGCQRTESKTAAESRTKTQPPIILGRKSSPPARPGGVLPKFTMIARAAAIRFTREDDIGSRLHRILESNGGGAALFDSDRDGLLDLFFTNGCPLPLKANRGTTANRFYRNRDGTKFDDVSARSGLSWSSYCYGVAVGDFDSDGFDDLYVNALGRNAFYRNNGDGTFTDVTQETGTAVGKWGSSCALADFNGDGHLDLYVVNYVKTGDDPPRLCPDQASPDGYITCTPTIFTAEDDVLFLSDGQGGFIDATIAAGITGKDGKGLGVVVFDADGDHRPDIYVANDGTPNFLYLNRTESGGPLHFEERAAQLNCAQNFHGQSESSMGVACGDYDADGRFDLFVTHFYKESNTMYRNLGPQGFEDATRRAGLDAPSRMYLAFGTEFIDFDNNGRLDLIVANGHIDDFRWQPAKVPYRMQAQFFRNEGGGRFIDVSAFSGEYFARPWLGRGLAVGDVDNDGDLDAAVNHQLDPSELLRNDTPTKNRSAIVQLVGTGRSNRTAVGAHLEAEGLGMKLVREVLGGGGYQASSDRRVHIGLGDAKSISRLHVRWPSGREQTLENVAAGIYTLAEGGPLMTMPLGSAE